MAPRKTYHNQITERKAQAKSSKRMKQIFVGKSFSFSGDFGENWTHEQMAQWIKVHGGRYEREVSDDTTHLICTISDYKAKTRQVKKAWALGSQCHIVVKDWLEDCLIGHATQKRCRAEKGYSLSRVVKRVKSSLDKQKEYRLKFEEGVQAAYDLVDNRLNHIYFDETGFEYKVVCTRLNCDGKVRSEKYTIYLFESNAKPCHYMAGAKLTSPGRKPSFWRDECHPKRFWDAFRDFQGWFKNVTGREWDDRLNQSIPYDSQKFRYAVPTYGRPVGAIPVEKLPLGWFDYNDNENEDDGKNGEGKEESEEDGQLAYDTDSEPDEDEDGDTNMNGQGDEDEGRLKREVSVISISSGD